MTDQTTAASIILKVLYRGELAMPDFLGLMPPADDALIEAAILTLSRCGMVRASRTGSDMRTVSITDMGRAVLFKLQTGCRLHISANRVELLRSQSAPRGITTIVCRWWTGRSMTKPALPLMTPETLLSNLRAKGIIEKWQPSDDGVVDVAPASSTEDTQKTEASPFLPDSRKEQLAVSTGPVPAQKQRGSANRGRSESLDSRVKAKAQWVSRETRFSEPQAGGAYERARNRIGRRLLGSSVEE